MTKLKLGDDFSDESASVDPSDEDPVVEDDTSSEDLDDETVEEDSEELETDESEEEEEDVAGEVPQGEEDDDRERELQGLINTESELDSDLSDLDIQIQSARDRIVQKRQARRDRSEIIQTIGSKDQSVDDYEDPLSGIDEEQIEIFERIAKARGYIPEGELRVRQFESARSAAQDAFLDKHPEYKVENDDGDVLYNALKSELALFAAPEDPKLIPKLFERAHEIVLKSYPERFVKNRTSTKQQIAASSRTKIASSGSQTPRSAPKKEQTETEEELLSDEQINILKNSGWSEEEILELME